MVMGLITCSAGLISSVSNARLYHNSWLGSQVLVEQFGIKRSDETVHSYTNDQRIQDLANDDLR
jgi:hypothetical protein